MKTKSSRAYLRVAAAFVALGAAALIGNWVGDILRVPSDSEVQERLNAIQDREVAEFSMHWAAELWYDKENQKAKESRNKNFEDLYKPACLFAREDARSPDSGYIFWRRWAYVYLARSASNGAHTKNTTILVLISADEFGLNKAAYYFLSSPDFRGELAALRITSFDDMQAVDDCQGEPAGTQR